MRSRPQTSNPWFSRLALPLVCCLFARPSQAPRASSFVDRDAADQGSRIPSLGRIGTGPSVLVHPGGEGSKSGPSPAPWIGSCLQPRVDADWESCNDTRSTTGSNQSLGACSGQRLRTLDGRKLREALPFSNVFSPISRPDRSLRHSQ